MKPTLSFIIPSLGQQAFLAEALDSIASQKLSPGTFEVLVIDGGSRDGTTELLSRHPLVTYWESTPDRGQGHALNKGLARAKGEIIGWLNADDRYHPGAVTRVIELFTQRPDIDLIYGDSFDIDTDGQRLRPSPVEEWSREALLDSCIISQPACFFRASFAQRNGPLREDLHLTLDYEYWLRASKWATAVHVCQHFADNRVHPSAKSSRHTLAQMYESALLAHHYCGQWRPRWLRRIVSTRARSQLSPLGLETSFVRPLLSALHYSIIRCRITLGRAPFTTNINRQS